ncbi:methyl-accepting chemotaxis protein [Desulfosarcina ovata]|uniref:Methyl-accepting chemotaxis protein n=1 Tax=Desulfosarcina ovata subsp. ovata TaxID=2752305 RepID=A0A5K8A687_9BACT|nr:HAMP domain-containing methyl-accepting chemotaxis protein [Desulfosarcina ovata]BBO88143.1 hypothetical protein DSCOOX_13230 [Desulfosarcina ovata subsp. ovata]
MVVSIQNLKIKTKFLVLGGIALTMSLVSIFGMLEIAKTTHLQKLERDHIEDAIYLEWKTSACFRSLNDHPGERDANTATYVTKESDIVGEMGMIQLVLEIKKAPIAVYDAVNSMEIILFKLLGFGETFEVLDKDLKDAENAEKILRQYVNNEITDRQLIKRFSAEVDKIKDNSARFSNTMQSIAGFIKRIMLFLTTVTAFAMLGSMFLVAKMITTPILKITDTAKQLSEGDLTKRTDIKTKDELGELSSSFDIMVANTKKVIEGILSKSGILNDSSGSLSSLSEHMTKSSADSSGKANSVAAAAEEMSANMNSVSAATEQASTNVTMVATAMEEMSATINEIAQNTEKASGITGKAVTQAQSTSDKVNELGQAANQIGKVTETITEISEQTNLLALNATIEAARAGEAGKGFAVVANEIKELAKQTAEATQEIKNRIEGIQGTTAGTVTEIEHISRVISEINEIVVTIATAVEEQSVTGKDIAENVAQASQGIQEATENVAQSSTVSGEIAGDISEVNQTAGEISNSSSQVNMSAQELMNLSAELKEMVSQFKV